jgi:hypothetical protein
VYELVEKQLADGSICQLLINPVQIEPDLSLAGAGFVPSAFVLSGSGKSWFTNLRYEPGKPVYAKDDYNKRLSFFSARQPGIYFWL